METSLDEVLALLGAKEVQIYSLSKRVAELEAQQGAQVSEPRDPAKPSS